MPTAPTLATPAILATLALAALLPALAAAQEAQGASLAAPTGDAAAGEAVFERQCASCHVVQDEAGAVLAGRSARTGPNLHGVVGRVPGTHPDYAYSDAMEAYGDTGAVWEEASFVPYVQDPTGFLREALGDPRARGKMAYRVRDEQDARDVYGFLATFPAGGAPAGE
jgi:cytochrome c